ncbi:TraB/GumN family protein [Chitinophaga agri]|uniref:TraB/GumN family protein n=1 Tax=Chitinophaga agri TaxID=2703787 RepID=A0A6B9Z876_9BACT|nr:TraB/GumN family protein [Chitinophaga agri]QHS58430.1 TraB/GumN family protein [Chitinophaga agri]
MSTCKLIRTILVALALAFTALTPAVAQKQPQNGLLWEISGRNMTAPAYLFGTIHLYDTSTYQLPQPPFELLEKTGRVYFELDFGKINMAEMSAGMFITDTSQYINKLLDPVSLARLNKLLEGSASAKMLGDRVYTIKPLFVSVMLLGNEKTSSVDLELYKAAMSGKHAVGGLETVKEQMEAFNTMSIAAQTEALRQFLSNDLSGQEILSKMTAIYARQNITNMLKELEQFMPLDANTSETLVNKRNIIMTDRIDSLLQQQEHPLIAVGAGHLGSDAGIVELLRKKGYTLKNIPFTIKKAHE